MDRTKALKQMHKAQKIAQDIFELEQTIEEDQYKDIKLSAHFCKTCLKIGRNQINEFQNSLKKRLTEDCECG